MGGKVKRIRHNDLTHYFLRPHSELPASYLASCEKFFKELSAKQRAASIDKKFKSFKQQATSTKPQASSCKLDGWPDSGYSRIIKEKL